MEEFFRKANLQALAEGRATRPKDQEARAAAAIAANKGTPMVATAAAPRTNASARDAAAVPLGEAPWAPKAASDPPNAAAKAALGRGAAGAADDWSILSAPLAAPAARAPSVARGADPPAPAPLPTAATTAAMRASVGGPSLIDLETPKPKGPVRWGPDVRGADELCGRKDFDAFARESEHDVRVWARLGKVAKEAITDEDEEKLARQDRQAFLEAAAAFWREVLTPEERSSFRERAVHRVQGSQSPPSVAPLPTATGGFVGAGAGAAVQTATGAGNGAGNGATTVTATAARTATATATGIATTVAAAAAATESGIPDLLSMSMPVATVQNSMGELALGSPRDGSESDGGSDGDFRATPEPNLVCEDSAGDFMDLISMTPAPRSQPPKARAQAAASPPNVLDDLISGDFGRDAAPLAAEQSSDPFAEEDSADDFPDLIAMTPVARPKSPAKRASRGGEERGAKLADATNEAEAAIAGKAPAQVARPEAKPAARPSPEPSSERPAVPSVVRSGGSASTGRQALPSACGVPAGPESQCEDDDEIGSAWGVLLHRLAGAHSKSIQLEALRNGPHDSSAAAEPTRAAPPASRLGSAPRREHAASKPSVQATRPVAPAPGPAVHKSAAAAPRPAPPRPPAAAPKPAQSRPPAAAAKAVAPAPATAAPKPAATKPSGSSSIRRRLGNGIGALRAAAISWGVDVAKPSPADALRRPSQSIKAVPPELARYSGQRAAKPFKQPAVVAAPPPPAAAPKPATARPAAGSDARGAAPPRPPLSGGLPSLAEDAQASFVVPPEETLRVVARKVDWHTGIMTQSGVNFLARGRLREIAEGEDGPSAGASRGCQAEREKGGEEDGGGNDGEGHEYASTRRVPVWPEATDSPGSGGIAAEVVDLLDVQGAVASETSVEETAAKMDLIGLTPKPVAPPPIPVTGNPFVSIDFGTVPRGPESQNPFVE